MNKSLVVPSGGTLPQLCVVTGEPSKDLVPHEWRQIRLGSTEASLVYFVSRAALATQRRTRTYLVLGLFVFLAISGLVLWYGLTETAPEAEHFTKKIVTKLGAGGVPLTPRVAAQLNIPMETGLLVHAVGAEPARAGMQKDDVIVAVGGKPLVAEEDTDYDLLERPVRKYNPGDLVVFTVRRAGKTIDLPIVVESGEHLFPNSMPWLGTLCLLVGISGVSIILPLPFILWFIFRRLSPLRANYLGQGRIKLSGMPAAFAQFYPEATLKDTLRAQHI